MQRNKHFSEKDLKKMKRISKGASKEVYFDEEYPHHLILSHLSSEEFEINKVLEKNYSELNEKVELLFRIPKIYKYGKRNYIDIVKDYDFHFKFSDVIQFFDMRTPYKMRFEKYGTASNFPLSNFTSIFLTDIKLISILLKGLGQFYALLNICDIGCSEYEVLFNTKTYEINIIDFEFCNTKFEGLPTIPQKSFISEELDYNDEEYIYINNVFTNSYNETILAYNI